ncbi:MAG: trypsin-like peptidase domain-containing protein [Oscillibacter sp.]|nr:trypsin-like peptidase domain-containing protein [Oscillibacter sp.]
MKQKILAILCALALVLSAVPAAGALEGESARAAATLTALHVLDEQAAADPAAPFTRAQANALLVRLSGIQIESNTLDAAVDQGWTAVTSGQQEAIPAGEFFHGLLRLLGYTDIPADAARYARHIGLAVRDCPDPLTWGDACQLLRDALPFADAEGVSLIQRLIRQGLCTQASAEALGLFPQALTARQTAERYISAVFRIRSFDTERAYKKDLQSGEASGFFISPDGLAVTNHHALDDALRATATLVTGETYEIERVLWYDPDIDLALIRVSRTSLEGELTPAFACLTLSETGTADLRPGDEVYTLGNPLGLGLAVSSGIVSAVEREVENYGLPMVMNTADISQGSSGGALLNVYGHVVAVTSGAYTYGNNMYLAVPIDPVLDADCSVEGMTLEEALVDFLNRED